ncbi:MAG: FAD-binding oxidoreductase [Sandaracinaceae bacterium]
MSSAAAAAPPARSRPTTLAEAREAMRAGEGTGELLDLRGGGTKAGWGRPTDPVDRVVETSGLDALVHHDPADMTATVGAGMALARLQRLLGERGQWLAVDPPTGPGASATVGGVFSAHDAGPRRLAYGSLRELVIGMTVVLADGSVARSGGRVIKNVAGYDLCKLFGGSMGTLGLVAELTVRVHPLPVASVTLVVPAEAREATRAAIALAASPLGPTAVDHDQGELLVRFEGAGASRLAERARGVLGPEGQRSAALEAQAEDDRWAHVAQGEQALEGTTTVRAATLPADYGAFAERVRREAGERGVGVELGSHVLLGLHRLRLRGPVAGQGEVIAELRKSASVTVRHPAPGLLEHVDALGPPPASFALMGRVKRALDPKGRCCPGRLWGQLAGGAR